MTTEWKCITEKFLVIVLLMVIRPNSNFKTLLYVSELHREYAI